METNQTFSHALQRLRKLNGLTQEQLAEQLFVSRTAVSKWETGGGYPSLDTLMSISELFGVSVDDLLSGSELVGIAEDETRANTVSMVGIIVGILDIAAALLFVLPLYGVQHADGAYIVSLAEYCGITQFGFSFVSVIVPLVLAGIVEIVARLRSWVRFANGVLAVSAAVHVLAVLLFAAARQPYATALLFVLFAAKAAIALYSVRRSRP